MPGLVVVFGDSQAESIATRAAQPLLRRPWERLSILVSADGTTAVGFAGERGGVARDETTGSVAALDGELYGPVRSGPAAAGELLSLYLRDGTELEPPEGSFAAAVCDGRTGRLVLLTDPFAGRPLFLADGRERVVAAGELKAIVSAGLRPELDLQALAEVLAYRWTLADRTLVAGVRELPSGTTLVLDGEDRSETRRWRFRVEPEEGAAVRELVAEFGRLLAGAVEARLDGSESLALSGGLDSRCIAAHLAGLGFEGVAATYGMRGTPQLAPAGRIAEAIGLRHRFLPLESGHTARWAPASIWLTDGRKWPFSTREVAFRRIRSELGSRALVMGTRGDDVVRLLPAPEAGPTAEAFAEALHRRLTRGSDRMLDEVMEPELAAALRGRAAAALAEQLASDGKDRQAFYAKIRFDGGSWVTSPGLYDDHLVPATLSQTGSSPTSAADCPTGSGSAAGSSAPTSGFIRHSRASPSWRSQGRSSASPSLCGVSPARGSSWISSARALRCSMCCSSRERSRAVRSGSARSSASSAGRFGVDRMSTCSAGSFGSRSSSGSCSTATGRPTRSRSQVSGELARALAAGERHRCQAPVPDTSSLTRRADRDRGSGHGLLRSRSGKALQRRIVRGLFGLLRKRL